MDSQARFTGLRLAASNPSHMARIWNRHLLGGFGSLTVADDLQAELICKGGFPVKFIRLGNIRSVPGSQVTIHNANPRAAADGLTQDLVVNGGRMHLWAKRLPINGLSFGYPESLSLENISLITPPSDEPSTPRISAVEVSLGNHVAKALTQKLVSLRWESNKDYLANTAGTQTIRFTRISADHPQVVNHPLVGLQFTVYGESIREIAHQIADSVLANGHIKLEVHHYANDETVLYGYSMGGVEIILRQG